MCTKHSNLFMARENKDHSTKPCDFFSTVRRVGEPSQPPSAPDSPASMCFECAAATQQSSCWVLGEPISPLLNIWDHERVHTCSTEPGGNGPWTFGSSPIKVMGTQCFQIASLESSAQSWHRACCVLQKMVRSSCGHTTSSNSLGHIQAWICKEEKLQFSSTSIIFPSPFLWVKGAGGVQEGDAPFRRWKHSLPPQPQHQEMALSTGHVETRDTMGMRGSASHSHSCGPAGLR